MKSPKIKVVKRSEVKNTIRPKKTRVAHPRAAAREMVSTVTEWVSDLKQRKTEETKIAIESLFGTNRQPTES